MFLYWLVQTSADWLWEFPALGGAAFAFLGLAAGPGERRPFCRLPAGPRAGCRSPGVVAALAAFRVSLLGPVDVGHRGPPRRGQLAEYPDAAFRQLDKAADLQQAQRAARPARGRDRHATRPLRPGPQRV